MESQELEWLSTTQLINALADGGCLVISVAPPDNRFLSVHSLSEIPIGPLWEARIVELLSETPMSYIIYTKSIILIGDTDEKAYSEALTTMQLDVRLFAASVDSVVASGVFASPSRLLRSKSMFQIREKLRLRPLATTFDQEPAPDCDALGVLPHAILDNLFLGDYQSSKNPRLLNLGVTGVVNAAGGLPNPLSGQFKYLKVDLADSALTDIQSHFAAVIKFVNQICKSGGKVLINCAAGVSRSTTLVLAYLMASKKMTLKEAYLLVKHIRQVVDPNPGFVAQLIEFEISLFGRSSVYADRVKFGFHEDSFEEEGYIDL